MDKEIKKSTKIIVEELLAVAKLSGGDIMVVGCSSSEIVGEHIGKGSSYEAAEAVVSALLAILNSCGVFLAAQCCEHLNRALIVEREAAEKYGLEIVSVVPQIHAGGSFATATYAALNNPVVVENVKAHAGIDIGDTLIGMHLKAVAVPVRTSQKSIGQANVVTARSRPKYIGGIRAKYDD